MRLGLPAGLLPDVVPLPVDPREDTPHAVAEELRRSAFFRGAPRLKHAGRPLEFAVVAGWKIPANFPAS